MIKIFHRSRFRFTEIKYRFLLRCATVLTYREKPIRLRVSADTECNNN